MTIHDLHIAGLMQALGLGLALGFAKGAYTAWPRPPAIIAGEVTRPVADPHAVPLPRFPYALAGLARHPTTPPREARPAARPRIARTEPAAGEPAIREPATGEIESQSAPDAVPDPEVAPVEPLSPAPARAAPDETLTAALTAYETGRDLYVAFVRGEGDRSEIAPTARAELNRALELLDAARRRHPDQAQLIDARIEEATSYLAFLVHYGG